MLGSGFSPLNVSYIQDFAAACTASPSGAPASSFNVSYVLRVTQETVFGDVLVDGTVEGTAAATARKVRSLCNFYNAKGILEEEQQDQNKINFIFVSLECKGIYRDKIWNGQTRPFQEPEQKACCKQNGTS